MTRTPPPQIPLPIQGDGFLLRAQRRDDADGRFRLHSDPDYVAFIGDTTDRAKSDAQLNYELGGKSEHLILVIASLPSDEMVGECVLTYSTVGEAEITIGLLPAARGRSIAKSAIDAVVAQLFEDPYYKQVVACVRSQNDRAIQLVSALGMSEDGEVDRIGGPQMRYVLRRPPDA